MGLTIRQLFLVLITVLPALAWASAARAEAPLRLGSDLPYAVLADPGGALSATTVTGLPERRFTARRGGFAAGYAKGAYWLRLELPANPHPGEERWLELAPPFLDDLLVLEPNAGGWRSHRAGDLLPLSERELGYRNFVIRLAPNSAGTLYIRLASSSTLMLHASLWRPAEFAARALADARDWGLYFGAAALTTVFMLGLAVVFRKRVFLAVLAGSANYLLVAGLQGFSAWLLWPESPQWASASLGISACLGSAAAIWIARESLELPRHHPRLDRLYVTLIVLVAVASLSVPLGLYRLVAAPALLLTQLAAVGAVIVAARLAWQGSRLHLALGLVFLVHLLSVAPALAINFGLMRADPFLHTLWQYELIPHMLIIAGILLYQSRLAHRRWISEQHHELLKTHEAQGLLEQVVSRRTRELEQARGETERALQGERQALFQQRQFMAMVSHEFRTPLGVIDASAVNLTVVPPADSVDLAARAEQILRAARRLTRLTDTCLADARLSSEAFAPQFSRVDMVRLAEEAAEIVAWSARHRLQLEADTDSASSFPCDPALTRIALSILLDNALKYSPEGTITLTLARDAAGMRVRLADQGKGIPEPDRARIFERFQRGESAPGGKGIGLGLTVARQIARVQGGELALLESSPRGSVFELFLPDRNGPAANEPPRHPG